MYIESYSTNNIVSRVAKNTGCIMSGNILNTVIGIITVTYLARYLGSEGFGKYSFVFAYLWFFGFISDLGINTILIREISRDKTRAGLLIGNSIIIKLLLSFLAIILSCLATIPLKSSPEIRKFVFIGALSFIFSFGSVYKGIFQANLEMLYPTAINILDNIVKFILFIWLIAIKATLVGFVIASVVYILPGLFVIIYYSRKLVTPNFNIDFGLWKNLFRESWPLALTTIFIIIYTRVDQLMLFHMRGPRDVGYYAAAVRLVEAFTMIPFAFTASILPLMSNYFKTSPESLKIVYKLSFKYILMIILPIATGITLLSKQITILLFGKEFLPSVPALAILIWSEVFVFYGIVHQNLLISTNQQKIDLRFTFIAAVANIILNLILIPVYGIVGASIATLFSYALGAGAIIGLFIPATRVYNIAGWQSMVKPCIASFLMGIFMFFMGTITTSAILGGVLVFIAVMFFIGGINQQDARLIKAIFRKESDILL